MDIYKKDEFSSIKSILTSNGYYHDFQRNWNIRKVFELDDILKKWDFCLLLLAIAILILLPPTLIFTKSFDSSITSVLAIGLSIIAILYSVIYFFITPFVVNNYLNKKGVIDERIISPNYWKHPKLIDLRNKKYAEDKKLIPDDIIHMILSFSIEKKDILKSQSTPWYEVFFLQTMKIVFPIILGLFLTIYKGDIQIQSAKISEIIIFLTITTSLYIIIHILWHNYFLKILNLSHNRKINHLEEYIATLQDIKILRIQEQHLKTVK